nr:hypothetical protein [Tanacetum cinerariifolium]
MVDDLRYFNSLESEVDSLTSQLETQTQFVNEIDRLSREYFYADHMNAILGVYTELDEVTNLQCVYLELLQKCECLETELSKRKSVDTKIEKSSVIRQPNAFKNQRPSILGKLTTFSNSFIRTDFSKSTSVTKNNVSNDFSKPVTTQILPTLKKPCLKNTNMLASGINSHGKKMEVEEHRRNVKLSKNKMPVTACTDNLNAKTVNVKSVSTMCAKCVMTDKHDVCVTKSVAKPIRKT